MPIPVPTNGQTEQEYVSECISQIIDEYGEEQASAICYNTYREETKMSTASKIASKLREIQYRGIRLAEGDGLESSCWEGYEAIGTKELDGKSVPNCVPIKE
jgi:hypothetical protein